LEQDDLGWPPASREGRWAEPRGSGEYRIDDRQWFVTQLAADARIEELLREGSTRAGGRSKRRASATTGAASELAPARGQPVKLG
jgi:hypothetical protein